MVEGEVSIPEDELKPALARIRADGDKQRESLQSYGVADISCPILGPGGAVLAVLTPPGIRRMDRHAGPTLDEARERLLRAAQTLCLNGRQRE